LSFLKRSPAAIRSRRTRDLVRQSREQKTSSRR
jgi:hypothetical protein